MRARVSWLGVLTALVALAASCDGGPPGDDEIRACLEDAGARVRPANDLRGELLIHNETRPLFAVTWPEERRIVVVMRAPDEATAKRVEASYRDLFTDLEVRREGELVVTSGQEPAPDGVVDCVS